MGTVLCTIIVAFVPRAFANIETLSGIAFPEWAPAIIVGVTCLFIGWQAYETRRAAKAAADSVGAIDRQSNIMAHQTKILEESVAATTINAYAANASAAAAKKSIDMLISKERPRIRIDVGKLNLSLPPEPCNAIHFIDYKVFSYGPTPAFITDAHASSAITCSVESLPEMMTVLPMPLPSVIYQNTEGLQGHGLLPQVGLTQAEIDDINQGKSFVHICGVVKYKDVFENTWETKVRKVWQASPYGHWVECGPPEDNAAT